jgi:hypothetical protein
MGGTISGQGLRRLRALVLDNSSGPRDHKNYLSNGYRACDGAAKAPITARTVRAQQEWMYANRGYATINLQKQFVLDLIKQLQLWKKAGHDLVVILDANKPVVPGSAIVQLIYACGLTDAHTQATEAIEPPPTHNRGSCKIDFVLVSSRLVPAIMARTILPLYDGYLSDYRALIVNFDSSILFAGPTSEVVQPRARQLTSTHPKGYNKSKNTKCCGVWRS